MQRKVNRYVMNSSLILEIFYREKIIINFFMSFYISQENDVKIIKNNLLTIVLKAIINGIMDILVH